MNAVSKEELYKILLENPTEIWVRVPQKVARQLLLTNSSIICGGTVFYFLIKNLGLGVCEVCKAPITVRETKIVLTQILVQSHNTLQIFLIWKRILESFRLCIDKVAAKM